jgi:hypothetical protein
VSRYAGQSAIRYDEIIMGRVSAVYDVVTERRLLIDVQALDGRATWQKVPLALSEGVVRNFRKNQIVALAFRMGFAKYPIVIGHLVNLENTTSHFADTLPSPFQNLGDQVYYHHETGSFLRFRSATATASTEAGESGQPALIEIVTASGERVVIDEQQHHIGVVAQKIGIGDLYENLAAANASITNADLKTIASRIDNERLSDLKLLVDAMVTAGIPNAAALQATVNGWTVATIGATSVPAGSQTVNVKE